MGSCHLPRNVFILYLAVRFFLHLHGKICLRVLYMSTLFQELTFFKIQRSVNIVLGLFRSPGLFYLLITGV